MAADNEPNPLTGYANSPKIFFYIDLAGSDPYNYPSLKAYFTREILYCDDHADRSEFVIEFLPEG